ncbi:substrate-binding and VWA domain-containing protein [Marinactinospora thermotolerans]|uniref:Ca-activated chloride channel family protein n=1 Tax=Marinactinospora thermotolerans DSM 45154 TaxID=1122192 RepID=A0A1T4QH75_9ACTN|nr:substrate-binding and VWA domain-containing protein [Marinactinospora thermotolerans]SKA03150.1 Ca-activated chloride channel family protein [Marinactinospora thermotolerans DSM 45154]
MERFAEEYGETEAEGACVTVEVVEQASGTTLEAIGSGEWDEAELGPRPDVWLPASSSWVQIARDRLQGGEHEALIPQDLPSIANSPLVIAMPRPMAEALGWPDESIGWSDLLELSTDGEGWGSVGHPEWGDFRMGKTNPNYSTSGLNATIGAYFAATGLTSDLTVDELASSRTRAFVSGVERSIVHYGDITMTFLANLQRADEEGQGLTYISAVAVEEMSVLHYNQGNPSGDPATLGDHAAPEVPLVAVYPEEGTLMSDHPYVVLDWADDARRTAAEGFLDYLLGAEVQQTLLDNGFRDHEGATGDAHTLDNGLIAEEPGDLLTLPSSGVLDEMLGNWAELRKPADVLIVVDTSGSMQQEVPGTGRTKLELAKAAATDSLEQFADTDEVGLWMFSTELGDDGRDWRELAPIAPMGERSDGRTHREEIVERVEGLPAAGGTGLYDTVLAAHRHVSAEGRDDAINAVVFLTDGRNEDAQSVGLEELIGELEAEAGSETTRVFTIAYGEDADLETVTRIAETTEAAAYDSSDPESIGEVFEAVISNF